MIVGFAGPAGGLAAAGPAGGRMGTGRGGGLLTAEVAPGGAGLGVAATGAAGLTTSGLGATGLAGAGAVGAAGGLGVLGWVTGSAAVGAAFFTVRIFTPAASGARAGAEPPFACSRERILLASESLMELLWLLAAIDSFSAASSTSRLSRPRSRDSS